MAISVPSAHAKPGALIGSLFAPVRSVWTSIIQFWRFTFWCDQTHRRHDWSLAVQPPSKQPGATTFVECSRCRLRRNP